VLGRGGPIPPHVQEILDRHAEKVKNPKTPSKRAPQKPKWKKQKKGNFTSSA
jgi:hypothetical protein